jgi:hypothetical protein
VLAGGKGRGRGGLWGRRGPAQAAAAPARVPRAPRPKRADPNSRGPVCEARRIVPRQSPSTNPCPPRRPSCPAARKITPPISPSPARRVRARRRARGAMRRALVQQAAALLGGWRAGGGAGAAAAGAAVPRAAALGACGCGGGDGGHAGAVAGGGASTSGRAALPAAGAHRALWTLGRGGSGGASSSSSSGSSGSVGLGTHAQQQQQPGHPQQQQQQQQARRAYGTRRPNSLSMRRANNRASRLAVADVLGEGWRGAPPSDAPAPAPPRPPRPPAVLSALPQLPVPEEPEHWRAIGRVRGEYHVPPQDAFAVVQLGPFQHKVTADDVILHPRLDGANVNDVVALGKVLLIGTCEVRRRVGEGCGGGGVGAGWGWGGVGHRPGLHTRTGPPRAARAQPAKPIILPTSPLTRTPGHHHRAALHPGRRRGRGRRVPFPGDQGARFQEEGAQAVQQAQGTPIADHRAARAAGAGGGGGGGRAARGRVARAAPAARAAR